jgi:pyruvate/2-oxoglutarate dehydrogenase complex dihydrolipoamide acyltransferase (E2) component
MTPVAIPQIFENMEEATIGKWLVQEGQTVEIDAPLCQLITEKTTLDLPSPASGTIRKLIVAEKAIVPTHFIVALIGDENEELPDLATLNPTQAPSVAVPTPVSPVASTPSPSVSSGGRLRATPAARRAAKDAGVALEDVAAAFPDKVLSEEDVKAFASR